MGCEVWVNKEVFICGMSFNSKQDLLNAIKECETTINNVKDRLKSFIFMTEPNKFFPDEDDIMFRLETEFKELMDEYDEAQIRLVRLWEFEEVWDKTHDKETGKTIYPVNPMDLKIKPYMGGDYMEAILEDGSEVPDDYFDVYNGFKKLEEYSMYNKLKTNGTA